MSQAVSTVVLRQGACTEMAYSEPLPTSKQGGYLLGGNYFYKKLHLRYLKRFWISYCTGNHKHNQTTKGKHKLHSNFKTSYISVLNHWKIFETSFTTESNNLPGKLALPYRLTSSLINNLIFYCYWYLMREFTRLLNFSQIFSYNFIKLATVFCFIVIL